MLAAAATAAGGGGGSCSVVGQSVLGVASVSRCWRSLAFVSRFVSGGMPYMRSSVASTEVWSYSLVSTVPCGISGEITSAGTRTPKLSNMKPPSLIVGSWGAPSFGVGAGGGATES